MSLVNKKGVDVSSLNGKISMDKIKNAGFEFVMIRCGFGENTTEQDDTYWEENVRKAEAAGLPWGVYFYSYALNIEQVVDEARHVLRLLKGKHPTLPIAFDMEDADGYKRRMGMPSNKMLVDICKRFCAEMKRVGYYPALYASLSWLNNQLNDPSLLNAYDVWVAQWNSSCDYRGAYGLWQYGGETNYLESNSIPGVGVIDKNKCYKDYPVIIKSGGFNGWSKDGTIKPEAIIKGVTAAQAMSAARSLEGKDEDPDECDIMKWYGGFDTELNEEACCCAGMMYLFGNKLKALDLIPGGKTANCGTLALNFHKAGQLHKPSEVRPADLVTFSWSGNPTSVPPLTSLGYKSFDHVEMCLKVMDDTILSIGANNGGLECDDFQIKTRRRSDISGCCRPKYADGGSSESATSTSTPSTSEGDSNVKAVQTWLNSHYGFDIYIDGIYGNQTRQALTKALQTELNVQFGAKLVVDGIIGPRTKAAIRNVSQGAHGNYTKTLQGLLICNGYNTGGFDGIFGQATTAAVRAYQSKKGLYCDGIAGPATFSSLCT